MNEQDPRSELEVVIAGEDRLICVGIASEWGFRPHLNPDSVDRLHTHLNAARSHVALEEVRGGADAPGCETGYFLLSIAFESRAFPGTTWDLNCLRPALATVEGGQSHVREGIAVLSCRERPWALGLTYAPSVEENAELTPGSEFPKSFRARWTHVGPSPERVAPKRRLRSA